MNVMSSAKQSDWLIDFPPAEITAVRPGGSAHLWVRLLHWISHRGRLQVKGGRLETKRSSNW